MDLTIFGTDKEKELNGEWTTIVFRGNKGKFLIARAGNDKFNRMYAKLVNQKRFDNPDSEEAQEWSNDCVVKTMAHTILLDTGDEITHNGEPVNYTPELGYQILSAYSELRNKVAAAAGDFETYATVKLSVEVKN